MRPEHDFFTDGLDGWTDRVFLAADHFRLIRFHGKGGADAVKVKSFTQAMVAADEAVQAGYRILVYAVTKSGRAACLAQDLWNHYAELYLRR
jgi:hypothetical protein